ncbi:hypothetical protein Peur_030439 [Populus x canadensis]
MFLKNVPEEVISTRVASAEQQDVAVNQHTAAALARICSYFETHKHFNYPYQFQKPLISLPYCQLRISILMHRGEIRASSTYYAIALDYFKGLLLLMNFSSQEEAVKHLDNAKQEKFHKDGDLQKQDLMATIEESDTSRGDFQFEDDVLIVKDPRSSYGM